MTAPAPAGPTTLTEDRVREIVREELAAARDATGPSRAGLASKLAEVCEGIGMLEQASRLHGIAHETHHAQAKGRLKVIDGNTDDAR